MKSPRNHPKKSSNQRGSAEAAGGNYWSQPCIRLMPSNDLFQRDWSWLLPSPARHGGCKKDRNRRAACPLPGQGEGSWKEERANKKRRRSESGGYGFASAGEPLLPSGFFS